MGLNNSTMANREVCDLIFCDYESKKPFLNLDYANVSTTELTGESLFAYGGKGHPKRVRFSGEKGGTLTIETQMQSAKLWQLLTGGDVETEASYVVREELTVTDKGITLKHVPAAASTIDIFKVDDDCGQVYQVSSASAKEVTLPVALENETSVIVYYTKEITDAVNISIKADSFPKNFIVYGDTIMLTEEGEALPYHMIAYKAAPQGNMSLSFTNNGDPSAITITCDLMADKDGRFLDLILEKETEA